MLAISVKDHPMVDSETKKPVMFRVERVSFPVSEESGVMSSDDSLKEVELLTVKARTVSGNVQYLSWGDKGYHMSDDRNTVLCPDFLTSKVTFGPRFEKIDSPMDLHFFQEGSKMVKLPAAAYKVTSGEIPKGKDMVVKPTQGQNKAIAPWIIYVMMLCLVLTIILILTYVWLHGQHKSNHTVDLLNGVTRT